jgi:hypothetical protein
MRRCSSLHEMGTGVSMSTPPAIPESANQTFIERGFLANFRP